MSQSYTNYFTYATFRPSPLRKAHEQRLSNTLDFTNREVDKTSNRCRNARECLVGGRPLCQRLQRQSFNRDGRT